MGGCMLCPRRCGAERSSAPGLCGAEILPRVARAALHFYEEPMLSGTRGSGAVFFSGCSLQCLFCQNHMIRDGGVGELCSPERLAELFLHLQAEGAHNINLVTPTPHIAALQEAIPLAKAAGLRVPIVYNTNGYELLESLQALEGLVDIYLPDLKYVSPALSERLSGAADYFDFAGPAILEMQRQVGPLQLDADGIAVRGLLLRHLVLPGCVDEACKVLDFIAENLPGDTMIALMRQYTPTGALDRLPKTLQRPLTAREYRRAVDHCAAHSLSRVLIQGAESADLGFTPAFPSPLPGCS